MKEVNVNNASPVVTLEATAKELDFSKLRADKKNKSAHSGEQMYLDLQRMDFVINGQKIDRAFLNALKEGVAYYETYKFWKSDFSNPGESTFEQLNAIARQLTEKATIIDKHKFHNVWKNHCNNSNTTEDQKTDAYKKEFKIFYDTGIEYGHLLPEEKDENKNFRPLVKEFVKEIFEYAGAEVPSDAILEELITNCNQAGYESVYAPLIAKLFSEHELFMNVNDNTVSREVHINCKDSNSVKVECKIPKMPVDYIGENHKTICDASFLLDFTLESKNDQKDVIYTDGKLSLTVPKELKNYKEGGKNLFDIIKECFQKCCEKLGFNFETKIKHNLGDPLKVNSCLEGVKLPIHSDEHVSHAG